MGATGCEDQTETGWGACATHSDLCYKHPPRPHSPNCASPIGGGEGNRMRRGACARPPSAPRTAPSPPPAGARHCRPSTEGALTSLAIPPQTPLPRSFGRVRAAAGPAGLHHVGHQIGGHGRDHPRCGGGDSALPQSAAGSGRVASCLRAQLCSWAPRSLPPRLLTRLLLGPPAPLRSHELPAAPPVGQQLHGQSAKWVHDRPAAPAAAPAATCCPQPWGHTRSRHRK